MPVHETPLDRAGRHVMEAERRLKAQASWIEEMSRLGYDTAEDAVLLSKMQGRLAQAREELAWLLAQETARSEPSQAPPSMLTPLMPDG